MKKLTLLLLAMTTILGSCQKKAGDRPNPFFAEWDTPFGVPPFDQIDPEHYLPAFDTAMARHLAEIDAIVANPETPGFDNVILALDNAGGMLRTVGGVFFTLSAADTNKELQKVEETISPLLAAHSDRVMLDDALFAKVKAVYDRRDTTLTHPQQRLLEKTYKDFVRSGALLSPDDKTKLKAANEQLAALTVTFGNNLLADNKSFVLVLDSADIGGLPPAILSAAAETAASMGHKGKWVFTLGKPSLIPFITYSDRRDLREKLYKGYLDRCNYNNETDNKQTINDIVRLRTERAHLLGYESHAAYVLDDEMAKTPANVYALLGDLWTPALRSASNELAEMKAIKFAEAGDNAFESWDWWYYAETVRKDKYALDEEMLRPYFALENVRTGIFDLSNRLYGITFRPITVPVYNKECQTYEVLDADNSHLGVLLLDFFPRDGKRGGAWCETLLQQSYLYGKKITPIVTITCNFTRPVDRTPSLLNLDETETFFHEFGHALHALFSDVPYRGLGEVERDFVELPSQIMENWAFEPDMLRRYAFHYTSGTPIPDYLIEKIAASSLFNQGFMTTEYLAASISDMDIHTTKEYKPIDVNAFEVQALNEKRGLIPQIAPRYRYPYFSHIFDGGYSAGYYSYIWSEVLDKDAYQAFVESGDIFSRKVATAFRTEILSKGGMEDGMVLYRNFRGAEPSREPLLRNRGLIEKQPENTQPNE